MNIFVIMPFNEEFEDIYKEVIKPVFEAEDLEVSRADDISSQGQRNIISDVVQGIASASLIVAEMTTGNRNVLYELGIAHTLKIPTVMITQELDDLPFDLASYRVIIYETHFTKISYLKDELQKIAVELKEDRLDSSNPIVDFLDFDINLHPKKRAITPRHETRETKSEKITEHETSDQSEFSIDSMGLWDAAALSETSMANMLGSIKKIGNYYTDLTTQLNKRVAESKAIQASNEPGRAQRVQRVLVGLSNDLSSFSNGVDQEVADLESHWSQAKAAVIQMYNVGRILSSDDLKAIRNLNGVLSTLFEQIDSVQPMAESGIAILPELKHLSRTLHSPINNTNTAMTRFVDFLITMKSDVLRLIAIGDDKLEEYKPIDDEDSDSAQQ